MHSPQEKAAKQKPALLSVQYKKQKQLDFNSQGLKLPNLQFDFKKPRPKLQEAKARA